MKATGIVRRIDELGRVVIPPHPAHPQGRPAGDLYNGGR